MKTHNITKLGYLVGFTTAILSGFRWLVQYNDPSQAIMGLGIGFLIIILSYIYNFMRNTDIRLTEIEHKFNAYVAFMADSSEEHTKNEIVGGEE